MKQLLRNIAIITVCGAFVFPAGAQNSQTDTVMLQRVLTEDGDLIDPGEGVTAEDYAGAVTEADRRWCEAYFEDDCFIGLKAEGSYLPLSNFRFIGGDPSGNTLTHRQLDSGWLELCFSSGNTSASVSKPGSDKSPETVDQQSDNSAGTDVTPAIGVYFDIPEGIEIKAVKSNKYAADIILESGVLRVLVACGGMFLQLPEIPTQDVAETGEILKKFSRGRVTVSSTASSGHFFVKFIVY